MRLVLSLLVCLIATSVRAQEQERKLVDRLLEPNMKLENPEQHRQFHSASNVTTASASTRSFYVPDKKLSQNFSGTREVNTTAFQSRSFTARDANLPAPARTSSYETKTARGAVPAREAPAKYQTRSFAGNRPFLEKGKSQKSLHAQDHPLSIDDVRELLNKNK